MNKIVFFTCFQLVFEGKEEGLSHCALLKLNVCVKWLLSIANTSKTIDNDKDAGDPTNITKDPP